MLENELKQNIAHNITALRKKNNMTQAELAEQLNYSDKSISKWERGDGLPDVFVLVKIAEMFGVTVNVTFSPAVIFSSEYKEYVPAIEKSLSVVNVYAVHFAVYVTAASSERVNSYTSSSVINSSPTYQPRKVYP